MIPRPQPLPSFISLSLLAVTEAIKLELIHQTRIIPDEVTNTISLGVQKATSEGNPWVSVMLDAVFVMSKLAPPSNT